MTLAHRAAIVGDANAGDPRAGHPLGQLCLLKKLSDPWLDPEPAIEQNRIRYHAFLKYEQIYEARWGGMPGRPSPHTRSHLASLVEADCQPLERLADDDRATQIRRLTLTLSNIHHRIVLYGCPSGLDVLHRALTDALPNEVELQMLRHIAPAFVKELKYEEHGTPA